MNAVQIPVWRRWWQQRRAPAATRSHVLGWGNLYVWPTPAGWVLAVVWAVLLLLSINYQLNLGYLLCFLLAGSTCASVWAAHRNLCGLQLHMLPVAPVFAGQTQSLLLQLKGSTQERIRYAVLVATRTPHAAMPSWVCVDVPMGQTIPIALGALAAERGNRPVDIVTVHSNFPLGIFRVWSHWQPMEKAWVYPTPEAHAPPLPEGIADSVGSAATDLTATNAGTEPNGVRLYQRGDRMRHIVWRKAAQTLASGSGELVSRDFQQSHDAAMWLDEKQLHEMHREARLARLCAWVVQAHQAQRTWGLRLRTGERTAMAHSEVHLHECLKLLAMQPANTSTDRTV